MYEPSKIIIIIIIIIINLVCQNRFRSLNESIL